MGSLAVPAFTVSAIGYPKPHRGSCRRIVHQLEAGTPSRRTRQMQDVPSNTGVDLATRRLESLARRLPSRRVWIGAGLITGLLVVLTLMLKGDGSSAPAPEVIASTRHPAAVMHVPPFITAPGSPDVLLAVMAIVLVGAVLGIGVFFFWLHSLPERLVHKSTKVHFDIVAVLALLSLFTHVHLFWVAALLLALVQFPDLSMTYFSRFLNRITISLERIADSQTSKTDPSVSGNIHNHSNNERALHHAKDDAS